MSALQFVKGDTNRVNIVVRRPTIDPATGKQSKDEGGLPIFTAVNLTGATITLTARKSDGTVAFFIETPSGIVVQGNPVNGQAIGTVAPAATSSLPAPSWYASDIQVVESDGSKTTIWRGQIVILTEVTTSP